MMTEVPPPGPESVTAMEPNADDDEVNKDLDSLANDGEVRAILPPSSLTPISSRVNLANACYFKRNKRKVLVDDVASIWTQW